MNESGQTGNNNSDPTSAKSHISYSIERLRSIQLPGIDQQEAIKSVTPFTLNTVLGAWRHRHKAAFRTLAIGGISDQSIQSILDPYTGVERIEDFRNIFEHNLAVGFVCAILGDWLVSAGRVAPDERDAIVVHGMTHDAAKPFEIFRGRFSKLVVEAFHEVRKQCADGVEGLIAFSHGLGLLYAKDPIPGALISYAKALAWFCVDGGLLPDDAQIVIDGGILPDLPRMELDLAELKADPFYSFLKSGPDSLHGHDSLPEALRRVGKDSTTINQLLESRGYGGAVESLLAMLAINSKGELEAQGNWIQKVVLLADNMTASLLPQVGKPASTYFLTTRERQVMCDLANRYPSLYARGAAYSVEVGFKDALPGQVEGQQWVGDYMSIQWFLSYFVAQEIVTIHTGKPEADPDLYVKKAVNTALSYYR